MKSEQLFNNSIFWVELDRVRPNPYQPRIEFDEFRLNDLAESIRQYGVLQPLVVTRHEKEREGGGLSVSYELIAGERRLRASKLAGLSQVPVIIRTGEESGKVKLELAIIENLQREDLNPIDRAHAFNRLIEEFNHKHIEVAKKVGKSREYVSNTIRLLALPMDIQVALAGGKITEGHTRPLLMLGDKPDEQNTLFKEVVYKRLTVREAESIARRIAVDKVRRKKALNTEMLELEKELTESLGTRVQIEEKEIGGKILIDYFSPDDLQGILNLLKKDEIEKNETFLNRFMARVGGQTSGEKTPDDLDSKQEEGSADKLEGSTVSNSDDLPIKQPQEEDEDIYSVKNFTI